MAIKCDGSKCRHYNKYYNVVQYKGGFVPSFNLPLIEYCSHTSVHKSSSLLDIGERVQSLKKCPLGDDDNYEERED